MAVTALVFLVIVFVYCDASESYCRQFEYDEKMLSKMIKTEIALEAVKKDLTIVEEKLNKKIESAIEVNNRRLDVQPVGSPRIGFTVSEPGKTKNGAMLFSKSHSNYGGGFKMARGRFVCEIPGLYLFSGTILGSPTVKFECYCRIYVGSTPYTLIDAHTKHTGDHPSGSASLVIQLKQGDEVYLGGCTADGSFGRNTHFSGLLVQ